MQAKVTKYMEREDEGAKKCEREEEWAKVRETGRKARYKSMSGKPSAA